MGDPIQSMPALEQMVKNKYTPREWLNYYRNVWVRNLIARTIDVQTDMALKAIDPERLVVFEGDETQRPVKIRLELRKAAVSDALDLIKSIDALLAIPEELFVTQIWSKEALAVAEDMKPKPKAAPAAEAVATAAPVEAAKAPEAPAQQQ